MKTKLQIVQGFRSIKNEAKYKIMKTTWLYKSAGFTGLGMSNTGINHCKQYISLLALQNGAFLGPGLDFLTLFKLLCYVIFLSSKNWNLFKKRSMQTTSWIYYSLKKLLESSNNHLYPQYLIFNFCR